jgi:LuxR family transcriptional regulator, maltose regulon positive regulatory protein
MKDPLVGLAPFPATKFVRPRSRPEHIERRRCLRALGGLPRPHHVLICGPAGAGKSTLAGQLSATVPVGAWVSLAPADNDPGQLFGAMIFGLRCVLPEFGEPALTALRDGADLRVVLQRTCDELLAIDEDVVVVLDDFHQITSKHCIEGIEALLEYAPRNVRFVVCTRTMPPIDVTRLEVSGQLGVVRAEDTRFDVGEIRTFLVDNLGLQLTDAELEQLQARTDGWAAGLYIASLSLHGGSAVAELMKALDAGERRITAYFSSETLAHEEPEALALLETLAVLGRFTAPLCDAVLQRDDSAARIAALERANMFVIPEDATGTSFRLHHLFANVLERRLATRFPLEAERLHRDAAAWLVDQGQAPEAIEHLLAAGAYEEGAHLISLSHGAYANVSRRGGATAGWLAQLPARIAWESVPMSIVAAHVAAVNGREAEMQAHATRAVTLPWAGRMPDGAASPEAQVALLRAVNPFGDVPAALTHAREAARLDDEQSPWWPLIEHLVGIWLYRNEGPSEEVVDWLIRATRDTDGSPMLVSFIVAPAEVACVLLDLGRRAEAQEFLALAQARHAATESATVSCAHAWTFRARALRRLGRVAEAQAEIEAGLAHLDGLPPEADPNFVVVQLEAEAALVAAAGGRREVGLEHLARARQALARIRDPARIANHVEEAAGALGVELPVSAGPGAGSLADASGAELSERELTVLRMLAGPLSLREIGSELFISRNTIKTHVNAIYRKLGVVSRVDAVAAARARLLIP